MAGVAGIGDAELFCHFWPDEVEGVAADKLAFDGDLDFRHMAGCALASDTCFRMVRVFGD